MPDARHRLAWHARVASRISCLPWARINRLVAGLTIVNATVDLAVWMIRLLPGTIDDLPLLAVLGLLSGVMAWHGRLAGHGAGLAFYGLQLAGYFSYDSLHAFPLLGALSLALVVHLPAGVLIVNMFALTMLAASAALLWWNLRTRQAVRTR